MLPCPLEEFVKLTTCIYFCRSSTSATSAVEQGNTSTPVLIALAAGLAGFFWWRWNQSKNGGGKSQGGRSPFKFPAAGKAKTAGAPTPVAAAASSSLPRNKASNNKKNKARRKDEKKSKQAEKE
jgi:hypothetical protein